MNQYQTERRLAQLYGLLFVLLGTSTICIAIAFNHWRNTLDVCPSSWLENQNCGCIFYGVSTYRYFNGGHNSYCYYGIFAPIPILVYAGIMALFHMYRVCINNIGQYENEKTTAIEEIETESIVVTTRSRVSHNNDAVLYCWIPSAVFAAVFAVYNLVHASIVTDGFLRTCKQYRGHLVKTLPASGNQATVIHFRLQCQAVFDFMDYLHQNTLVNPQNEYLNTGAALQIALIGTWVSVFLWMCVIVLTSRRAYRERSVLTCCGN